MIHPAKVSDKRPPRRAALFIGAGPRSGSTLVSDYGVEWYRDRQALLARLASPERPFSQVWLTPRSAAGWELMLSPLVSLGWTMGASVRKGVCHSLYIYSAGQDGAPWSGRSAAGFVDVPRGLSHRDECEATFQAIGRIDDSIRERWPGVGLGTTPSSTGASIFASMLTGDIGCDPQCEVTLRHAGAYGGGRIQSFVPPGASFYADEVEVHNGEMMAIEGTGPIDLDITGAYPLALSVSDIGAEYAGEASKGAYADKCVISWCAVEVPESMPFPPLRLDDGHGPAYPRGVIAGAWTGDELRAAEACGVKVLEVHTVWRFVPRPEFAEFGAAMRLWRAALPDGHPSRGVAKAIAVGTVGGWGMRPSTKRLWVGALTPDLVSRARHRGPALHELSIDKRQNRRALLPAACLVTGQVRAWAALTLHACSLYGVKPLYWHTDGGALVESEPGALDRALEWVGAHGGPPAHAWRKRRLREIRIHSPGNRYERREDGTEVRKGKQQ